MENYMQFKLSMCSRKVIKSGVVPHIFQPAIVEIRTVEFAKRTVTDKMIQTEEINYGYVNCKQKFF